MAAGKGGGGGGRWEVGRGGCSKRGMEEIDRMEGRKGDGAQECIEYRIIIAYIWESGEEQIEGKNGDVFRGEERRICDLH